MTERAHLRTILAAGLLLVATAACGADDDPVADADSTTSTAPDGTDSTEPAAVEVTAVDYGYTGLPESVAAGTTFTLKNSSAKEVHEIVAVRLPDDEKRPASDLVKDGPGLGRLFSAGPATVIVAAPGADKPGAVVGTGALDEPGRYLFVCNIPTGADPAEYMKAAAEAQGGPPKVDGGPPHAAQGMFAEVTVEA